MQTVRLDTLIAKAGLLRVDLIKLDVEGAEFEALGSGVIESLAAKHLRPMIVFEYNRTVASRAGWQLNDMQSMLARRGYEVHWLTPNGVGEHIGHDIHSASDPALDFTNLVAVPSKPIVLS